MVQQRNNDKENLTAKPEVPSRMTAGTVKPPAILPALAQTNTTVSSKTTVAAATNAESKQMTQPHIANANLTVATSLQEMSKPAAEKSDFFEAAETSKKSETTESSKKSKVAANSKMSETTKPTSTKSETTGTSSKKSETAETSSKKSETAEVSSKKSETAEASSKKSEAAEASSKAYEFFSELAASAEASSKKSETAEASSKKSETAEASLKKSGTAEASSKKSETSDTSSKIEVAETWKITEDENASSKQADVSSVQEIPCAEWLGTTGPLGATVLDKTKGLVSFRVWGPHIERCWAVLGENDEQRIEMVNEGEGCFACQVAGIKVGMAYHFAIESRWNDCFETEGHELRRRDPYARQSDYSSSKCFVVDPSEFKWHPFQPPPPSQLIIYELHVGTFAKCEGKSQFAAVAKRLDYVKQLGFNAIELMPVQEFGGLWGYNPRLLMAPHGPYGTPDELRTLVNAAHSCGLAVIFDVVLNRGSVRLNSMWNMDGYGPNNRGGIYFDGAGDSSWGSKLNFDQVQVRELVKAAALTFAIDYNADGLRVDAVHHIPWNYLKELTSTLKSRAPKCFLVAEVTPETPEICHQTGFDSCWMHSGYYNAMKVMRKEDSDSHIEMLKSIVNGSQGFRKNSQVINSILGSHDQCGNRSSTGHSDDSRVGRYYVDQWGGRDNWHARAICRMWYALQATARPLPMTFMGTETLQSQWWHSNRNFDWDLVANDSNTAAMMKMVKAVNALRKSSDSFTDEKGVEWVHEDPFNRIVAYHRGEYLIVANVDDREWSEAEYGLRTKWAKSTQVHQIFNSQAEEYGGWNLSWSTELDSTATSSTTSRFPLSVQENGTLYVKMPKWCLTVYKKSN